MASKQKFKDWIGGVKVDESLHEGLESAFKLASNKEVALLNRLKSVRETTFKGVFGRAVPMSKAVAMHRENLEKYGNSPHMWLLTLVHEARHAVLGEGEDGAIRAEWPILGRLFKRASAKGDDDLTGGIFRSMVRAQRQRYMDVQPAKRMTDVADMVKAGIPKKIAATADALAIELSEKEMRQRDTMIRNAMAVRQAGGKAAFDDELSLESEALMLSVLTMLGYTDQEQWLLKSSDDTSNDLSLFSEAEMESGDFEG